jgi:regulator of protease activity HflC (stomatin/prohibitin superfamily)
MATDRKPAGNGQLIALLASGLAIVAGAIAFVTWLLFMTTITVEPGHEQVIVDKPYFFGHEGVRPEPMKEGRILIFKTTTAYDVNMMPQSAHVAFDDFSSQDNILLDFETTIQFRYTSSVALISKFGEQWFANNVSRQYGAIVREAVKKRTMAEIMSSPTAAAEVDTEVTAALIAHVKNIGLPLEIMGVSLGRAKPNADVLKQMNETAAQQQRQKTLVAATAAEGDREKEQIAKAKADNAYRNAMGLDPHMFLQLEAIKRYSEACQKAGNTCIIDASSKTGITIGAK